MDSKKLIKIKPEKPEKLLSRSRLKENDGLDFKEDVLKKLNIDEFFTKADKKHKYNRFDLNVVPEEDFNMMCDLVELPTTKQGYIWLFVITDLATSEFDMEPMKNKTANSTVTAFKNVLKRDFIGLPTISIKSDNGTEFKSEFHKYLSDKGILHKFSRPYRHQQQSVVEGLNKTIVRILNNYMNKMALEVKEDYSEWTDILDSVRVELNKFRKRDLEKLEEYQQQHPFDDEKAGQPAYNVGDFVHFKLDRPIDALGNPVSGSFREGDFRFSTESREIVEILPFKDEPYYRFKLKDMHNASYSESELKPASLQQNSYLVRKIIGKKQEKKVLYYLVWWKGELKKDSTWEKATDLIEDGLEDEIKGYNQAMAIKARLERKKRY